MSTGDQSEYMRGKIGVRGRASFEQAAKFMEDGFDRFARTTEVGSGGRMMAIPENSGGRRRNGRYMKQLLGEGLPFAPMDIVNDVINGVKSLAPDLIPKPIQDAVNFTVDIGRKVKESGTSMKNLLRLPATKDAIYDITGNTGVTAAGYVSDFLELVGFGKFKNNKKLIALTKKSKPFKQFKSGKFQDTINEFREYAKSRPEPKTQAEFIKMIQDQANAAQMQGGAPRLSRNAANRALTKPPAPTDAKAVRTWTQAFKDWAEWVQQTYNYFSDRADTAIIALESAPLNRVIKQAPQIQDKEIAKKIADVTRVVFPAASKKADQLQKAAAAVGVETKDGAGRKGLKTKFLSRLAMHGMGSREDLANPNVKKDSSGMPLSYYLERADVAEQSGSQPKNVIDAYRAKYIELFKKLEGGASCCSGCDGGGECEGEGFDVPGMFKQKAAPKRMFEKSGNGRKPSAYAMFVKQFAAKNPGPNLMKRASEAYRSLKGGKTRPQTDAERQASVDEDRREAEGFFKAIGNEFTNPTSDLSKFLGVPQPQQAQLKVATSTGQAFSPERLKMLQERAEDAKMLQSRGIDPNSYNGKEILDELERRRHPNGKGRRGRGVAQDVLGAFGKVGNEFTNQNSDMRKFIGLGLAQDVSGAFGKLGNEFTNPTSDMRKFVGLGRRRGKGFVEDMNWLGNQISPQGMNIINQGSQQIVDSVKNIGRGRKPSAYAMFVKQFAAKHPGPNLMKRAGEAWRNQK